MSHRALKRAPVPDPTGQRMQASPAGYLLRPDSQRELMKGTCPVPLVLRAKPLVLCPKDKVDSGRQVQGRTLCGKEQTEILEGCGAIARQADPVGVACAPARAEKAESDLLRTRSGKHPRR